MGGQSIEIQIEPVTGEDGDAARCQHLPQAVNEPMRRSLRAGSPMKDWKKFRERIDGEPQPEHLCMVTEPCAQFIQLQVWEPQMAEAAFMQELGVLTCTREPRGDGGLSVAEDAFSRGRVQPFGQRRQYHGD